MFSPLLPLALWFLFYGDPPQLKQEPRPTDVNEKITVVAELSATPLRETASHVSLITAAQIETQLVQDVAKNLPRQHWPLRSVA